MPLSLQLYSMRNAPDADRVFADCAACGVSAVEGYGGVIADADACKRALDKHGLTMPSSHFALEDIRDAPETVIERAKFLGITKVFAPYLDAALRPKTASGYAAIADLLAERGKMFADHGLTVGWHNHDFEFETLEDGALPMQAMFDAQPDLPWEADLGWVIRAGVDPLDWLGNHMANIQAIHVKDLALAGENANEDGWADLGDGTADWAGIIQTVRTAKPDMLFVLEHDNPSDPYRYLQRSAQAFHSIWETTHG